MIPIIASPYRILITLTTLIQAFVVFVLVAPVPSNQVRGFIVNTLNHIWNESTTLRNVLLILNALNVIELYLELRFLFVLAPPRPPVDAPHHHRAEFFDMQIQLFAAERNTYLAAFSLFIYLIMRRLLDLQQQHVRAREGQKAALKGRQPQAQEESPVVIAEPVADFSPATKKNK
mmetsp:Transcript_17942/g.23375  ORF Transcript_17942/g.23375 Transcript_17942/m.23375 type:complete len:175 (-) Transcript_17942:386-910(-)